MQIYEQAVKRTPRDSELACRMGLALVKTHQYNRAINYYKDAIKTGDNNQLRYQYNQATTKQAIITRMP